MIEIKVNNNGKETTVKCNVHIEGRKNAVREFYEVIRALVDTDESVFFDAIAWHMSDQLDDIDEILGGDDDDESES